MAPVSHPLAALLLEAAQGRFPPADGAVRVLPTPPGASAAVVAFTGCHFVAGDVSRDEVLAHLPEADLGAPLGAAFLSWLGGRSRSEPGSVDVLLAATGPEKGSGLELVRSHDFTQHARVERAERFREGVEVYTDTEGRGVVTLGTGLAGRREVSIEVEPGARAAGLGRALALAARRFASHEAPLFAQVAPGNAASLRAFLAAGFRPIGAEVLFSPAFR